MGAKRRKGNVAVPESDAAAPSKPPSRNSNTTSATTTILVGLVLVAGGLAWMQHGPTSLTSSAYTAPAGAPQASDGMPSPPQPQKSKKRKNSKSQSSTPKTSTEHGDKKDKKVSAHSAHRVLTQARAAITAHDYMLVCPAWMTPLCRCYVRATPYASKDETEPYASKC